MNLISHQPRNNLKNTEGIAQNFLLEEEYICAIMLPVDCDQDLNSNLLSLSR